jgi:hypothetical protein
MILNVIKNSSWIYKFNLIVISMSEHIYLRYNNRLYVVLKP